MQITRSTTQISKVRSMMIAIAFFGFLVAVAIASPYYLGAPPFDPVVVGP